MFQKCFLLIVAAYSIICITSETMASDMEIFQQISGSRISRGFLGYNGVSGTVQHIINHCLNANRVLHCFKLQGARLLGRALKFQNINVIDGVTLIKRLDNETRSARTATNSNINLTNRDLENLSMKSLDSVLNERFYNFLQSRQIQVNMPRLLALGHRNSQWIIQYVMSFFGGGGGGGDSGSIGGGDSGGVESFIEEARKKKDKGGDYMGPFIAAVMMKAAMLKMAYHSIAIVAGKALIVGKIALIISAIIGLKKLVSSDGHEKTTYEIVKHPQVSSSHTYSSSHASEYDGGHESGSGGSYHRSIGDEMMMQDKAYNGWVPTPINS